MTPQCIAFLRRCSFAVFWRHSSVCDPISLDCKRLRNAQKSRKENLVYRCHDLGEYYICAICKVMSMFYLLFSQRYESCELTLIDRDKTFMLQIWSVSIDQSISNQFFFTRKHVNIRALWPIRQQSCFLSYSSLRYVLWRL